jgi:hypothetical protein
MYGLKPAPFNPGHMENPDTRTASEKIGLFLNCVFSELSVFLARKMPGFVLFGGLSGFTQG